MRIRLTVLIALLLALGCESDEDRLEALRLRETAAELDLMYFERLRDSIYETVALDATVDTDSLQVIIGPVTDSVLRARNELDLVRRELNQFMDGR